MSDPVKPWWVLQDGGGDVAALVETPQPGAQAVVAGQWTYDAYGSCLTAEHLRSYPLVHCGHKALFFDRLDVGVVGSSGDELPRLVPYAHAVYQMRNRAYAPALGRFYQRDPNATAMALLEVTAYHGRGLSAIISAFSIESMYGDGGNLYQYLGSNPWHRHDHLGLSEDPFEMVDEFTTEHAASVAAWMNEIERGLKSSAMIAATIVSFMPIPGAALLGDLAASILEGEDPSSVLMQHAAGAAMGLIPGGRLLGFLGSLAIDYVGANTDRSQYDDGGGGEADEDGGPAMAGGTPAYVNSTGKTHFVYVGRKGGRVVYVGITTDWEGRSRAHAANGVFAKKICPSQFSEYNARSMESALMTKFPGAKSVSGSGAVKISSGLRNKRLSIGRKHKFFMSALQGGIDLLKEYAPDILRQVP